MDMTEILAVIAFVWALVLKHVIPLLPGAVGATIALKFLGEGLSLSQRITAFFTGMVCVIYVAPALIAMFEIDNPQTRDLVVFLTGLFGLAVTREVFKEINDADLIGALKRHYLGGRK
jgi:hypothetical protein